MFRIVKVKKSLFILLFSCIALGMNAQLLSQKKVFTRMDSLRGSLRPERTCFDVTFYNLSVDFDTINKTITGRNAIYFNVTAGTDKIQIDLAENLSIDQIVYHGKPIALHASLMLFLLHYQHFLVSTKMIHLLLLIMEGHK